MSFQSIYHRAKSTRLPNEMWLVSLSIGVYTVRSTSPLPNTPHLQASSLSSSRENFQEFGLWQVLLLMSGVKWEGGIMRVRRRRRGRWGKTGHPALVSAFGEKKKLNERFWNPLMRTPADFTKEDCIIVFFCFLFFVFFFLFFLSFSFLQTIDIRWPLQFFFKLKTYFSSLVKLKNL